MKKFLDSSVFAICLIVLHAIGVDFDNFYKSFIWFFGCIGVLLLVVAIPITNKETYLKYYGEYIKNIHTNFAGIGIIAMTLQYVGAIGSLKALLMFTVINTTLLLLGLLSKESKRYGR